MTEMRTSTRRPPKGALIVEAAILFPILLMVTLGGIEYGWLFLNAQQVTNIARQGARIAARNRPDFGTSSAEAQSVINAMLVAARLNTYHPTVTITQQLIPGDPLNRKAVKVVVKVGTSGLLIVNAPLLFPTPTELRASVIMALET